MQNEMRVLVDNDKEICNILARYFNSVYTPESNDEMPEMKEMYTNEIKNIILSREDIQTRLEKLNVNKSCGPDSMHPFVLQKTAIETSKPLEIIFRNQWSLENAHQIVGVQMLVQSTKKEIGLILVITDQ